MRREKNNQSHKPRKTDKKMASLTKAINKDLFDKILPTFGNPRVHVPVWDEGQKKFILRPDVTEDMQSSRFVVLLYFLTEQEKQSEFWYSLRAIR